MRIVLDTTVLVSALIFGGNPRLILEMIIRGEVRLCLSEVILSEINEVLQRPKFGFPTYLVHQIISELYALCELIRPPQSIHEITDDPADNHILECAVDAHADFIISGDNHLLALIQYQSVTLVNPHQFLDLLGAP